MLDIFIDDAFNTINGSYSLKNVFQENELNNYKFLLQNYYSKFLNKKKYSTYSSIIRELLPPLIKFTDIYSLSIEYIKNYQKILNSYDKNFVIKSLFVQLFKKSLFPDPKYRLDSKQLKIIIEFFIDKLNSYDLKDFDKSYYEFVNDFDKLLLSIYVKKENFFFPDYAFIDFEKILTIENIKIFKSYKFSYHKCDYI